MDRNLIKFFWNCGDDGIIQFALLRAHLNRHEKDTISLMLDDCYSQEEAAEKLGYSTRRIQEYWYSGTKKLLSIPWVVAYSKDLQKNNE